MEDTLWSWVSSWKTKTQNPTHTLSNKTNVLKMVVRDEGGGSIFSPFDMYLQVFIYQINITYTINNIS